MQSGVGMGQETGGLGWKGARTGRKSRASPGGGGVRDCKRDSRRFPNNDGPSQETMHETQHEVLCVLKARIFPFCFLTCMIPLPPM